MACAVPSLFVYCVQTCPLRAFFRRAQALRATAAASLCLRAFHAPVQMRAAYSELYRMQIDRPRARWWCSAHSSARVNAIKVARLEVIVLTCGVAMVICPAIWKMHRPASTGLWCGAGREPYAVAPLPRARGALHLRSDESVCVQFACADDVETVKEALDPPLTRDGVRILAATVMETYTYLAMVLAGAQLPVTRFVAAAGACAAFVIVLSAAAGLHGRAIE